MWSDLRLAARLLARDSRFTVTAVLVLAIGMAATTTIFTLGNGVYLRDLPFATPDRIVLVEIRYTEASSIQTDNLSFPDLQDLRTATRAFDGIGVADFATMDLADAEHPAERLEGAAVSANMFSLIGQRPALGRDFTETDDQPGADPTVVLGYGLWQRRYGAAPDIVGRSVRVNGVPATVIGVMPDGFGFPTNAALWMPVAVVSGPLEDRGNRNLDAFGRLAPGVSIEQAESDLSVITDRLAREFPETNANVAPLVLPFRELNTGGALRIVYIGLMSAVALLLLVACANVANLLLVRGAGRAREMAVRLSLGASRGQIVRQLLVESFLLALVSGGIGLLGAAVGIRLVRIAITGTGEPYWLDFSMDWRVFGFVAATSLGTAILAGLAPARHAVRTGLAEVLNEAGRAATGALRARRLTDGLVVAQVAMSLTLLAGAGLMALAAFQFTRTDIGVDTDGLVQASVNLPQARYPTVEDRQRFHRQLRERLGTTPGLRAGITSSVPLLGAGLRGVSLDGRTPIDADDLATTFTVVIGPGYLEALGVSPLQGRLLTDADDAGAVALVNERFADRHFPGGGALGQVIQLEGPDVNAPGTGPLTIAGVVPNIRQASPRQENASLAEFEPVVYLPYTVEPRPFMTILARSDAAPAAAAAALRDAVRAIDPDLPVSSAMTLAEAVGQDASILVTFSSLFGLFAVAALGLASIGLYAVVAFDVAQRTRELGIRLALGAKARHIWWLVTRRAAMQIGIGIVLGLGGALGAGQLLQGILNGIDSRDPTLLVGLPALMVAVALLACAGPVRRAMRLDPATTLRAE